MKKVKVATLIRRRNGEVIPLKSELQAKKEPGKWIKPTHLDCGLDYVLRRSSKPMKLESFSSSRLSKTLKLAAGGNYSTISEPSKSAIRAEIQATLEKRKLTEVVVTFDTKEKINWRHGYDS